ncbi:hypothetical protein HY771_04000 [Candidatus Uhrbacteria bacterium]|nr:hypothetical protein [Candidatus Uhrbacteria bacterium]
MSKVTFIGIGEIGNALMHVIGERAAIRAWDKDSSKMEKPISLEESLKGVEIVFLCVPSWVVRDVCKDISPFINQKTYAISLAKGLEEKTLKTMDAVLEECLPQNQPFGVLGGPLLAEELMADLPGIGVLGAKDPIVFSCLQKLFKGSFVRLENASDPRTVALAAVLKNIYAVGLGIAEGLGWGWNGKGWLAAKGLDEMNVIARLLNADERIMAGPAGGGDFFATAMSPDSRNRETGREIAIAGECVKTSEGCRSIASVLELVNDSKQHLPFLLSLDRIINKHEKPKKVFEDLFRSGS